MFWKDQQEVLDQKQNPPCEEVPPDLGPPGPRDQENKSGFLGALWSALEGPEGRPGCLVHTHKGGCARPGKAKGL